jgi:hypothetical protein
MKGFKPGDRVEVIASDEHCTTGEQGMVKSASRDLVFVVLDKQPDLLRDVVIVDMVGNQTRIASAFRTSEIRHVVTPTT